MDKISELEAKLQEDMHLLQEIISDNHSNLTDDQFEKNRIIHLKKEVEYLNAQISLLESRRNTNKSSAEYVIVNPNHKIGESSNTNKVVVANTDSVINEAQAMSANDLHIVANKDLHADSERNKHTEEKQDVINDSTPRMRYYDGVVAQTSTVNKQPELNVGKGSQLDKGNSFDNSIDFEAFFGKSGMGIFASILIFISMITFATIILPSLNDSVKILLMFVVSSSFVGFGLFLEKSNIGNKFYLPLTGCGVGALFLSLILCNVYFNVINDIVLYLLILIWAILVCALSKWKSFIFQIIGQIGIFIAIMLGSISSTVDNNWVQLNMLIGFFIIAEVIFFFAHFEKQYVKNIINIAACGLGLLAISFGSPSYLLGEGVFSANLCVILICTFTIIAIAVSLFLDFNEDDSLLWGIINSIQLLVICISINCFVNGIWLIPLIVALLVTIEFRYKNIINIGIIIFQCALLFLLLVLGLNMYNIDSYGVLNEDIISFWNEFVFLIPFVIGFVIYGYLKKKNMYINAAIVFLAFSVIDFEMNEYAHLILGVVIFGAFAYLAIKTRNANSARKNILYILFIIMIFKDLFEIINDIKVDYIPLFIYIAVITAINFTANKTKFSNNWLTDESENGIKITTTVINSFLMFATIIAMNFESDIFIHFGFILLAVIQFFMNVKNILTKYTKGGGAYIGFKFTMLLVAVLNSYGAHNYMISIMCIIYAILCVVVGFKSTIKSLRSYGLVLSLIGIIKLILTDISHNNSVEMAFSLFLCGILCFFISYIYNSVDKRMNK